MKTQLFLCIYLIGMVQNVHSQTWIPQGEGVLPFGYAISSISVVDDTVIWVSAGLWSFPMKVFKSIDAGETWETYNVTSCVNCKSGTVEAVNGSTAWLTSQDQSGFGKLYKTEDGGQTWDLKLTDLSAQGAVKIFDDQHLLCQEHSYFAWSDDAGETWETARVAYDTVGYQPYLAGPVSVAGDTSWFGMSPTSNNDPGVSAKLIRATNFGRDISFIDCGIDSIFSIWLVSFRDHLHGMMTYSSWQYKYDYYYGYFYYGRSEEESLALSSDGGETWSTIQNPTSGIRAIMAIPDAPSAYIVTDATQISWTMDGGETWADQSFAYPLSSMDFSSRNSGWVAINGTSSDHPLVLKWNGDFISTTKDHSPIPYREVRVFPNPSQDIIYYSIDNNSQPYTLTLTDAVGQVVVEKEMHEMELNCSDLPAGVYFIRIQTREWIGVAKFVKD